MAKRGRQKTEACRREPADLDARCRRPSTDGSKIRRRNRMGRQAAHPTDTRRVRAGRVRCITPIFLFADNLHKDAFFSFAVELTVENLLPRTKVEFAVGDGNDDLSTHNSALKVGISVIFVPIVTIL